MTRSFKNKVVIITGGASGIGKALGNQFARNGARVCLLDQDADGVFACAKKMRQRGWDAIGIRCDVTKETKCRHHIKRIIYPYADDGLSSGDGG